MFQYTVSLREHLNGDVDEIINSHVSSNGILGLI
jgi:hypothetical protein